MWLRLDKPNIIQYPSEAVYSRANDTTETMVTKSRIDYAMEISGQKSPSVSTEIRKRDDLAGLCNEELLNQLANSPCASRNIPTDQSLEEYLRASNLSKPTAAKRGELRVSSFSFIFYLLSPIEIDLVVSMSFIGWFNCFDRSNPSVV